MNKLVEFVKKYKTENPTGWRKWVYGTLAVLAGIIIVAFFAIRAANRSSELASLKHERDVALERAHQSTADLLLAEAAQEKEQHRAAAEQAMATVRVLDQRINELDEEHKENTSVLDSIKSWDDVDRIVK